LFSGLSWSSTASTVCDTLSLHDALPICALRGELASVLLGSLRAHPGRTGAHGAGAPELLPFGRPRLDGPASAQLVRCVCGSRTEDRKSTRLNSSHQIISYAVFCLKNKKT